MKALTKRLLFSLFLLMVLGGCNQLASSTQTDANQPQEKEAVLEKQQDIYMTEQDGRRIITLEAQETEWQFTDELKDTAWTYNGILPGYEIRVQEGDHVQIHLKNSLPDLTALHLHGLPLLNEMDGVPGITQNAIRSGESFTYEFLADTPGTYWYHSHQRGAEQVGKGLYGALIIEPKEEEKADQDQVIVISEWSSMGMDMENMDHGKMLNESKGMGMDAHGMNHDMMNKEDNEGMDHSLSHNEMMKLMYDTMLINGKGDSAIEPIKVSEGETIKLRFVNAGLFTQVISIPGHSYRVTHYDGQEVNQPETISDQSLRIGSAERYDIEIVMNQPGAWGTQIFAEQNSENLQAFIPVIYKGYEASDLQTTEEIKGYFDLMEYGAPQDMMLNEIDKEYQMILDSNDGGETFTINHKQMPDHEIFSVEEGDVVKVTLTNQTEADHPMHLHGQFFYVVSRNGEALKGSPVLKDTLNVRPGETYEVIFEADNPGNWLFHCHELHHASGGMVSEVRYNGFVPAFTLDPTIDNQPE